MAVLTIQDRQDGYPQLQAVPHDVIEVSSDEDDLANTGSHIRPRNLKRQNGYLDLASAALPSSSESSSISGSAGISTAPSSFEDFVNPGGAFIADPLFDSLLQAELPENVPRAVRATASSPDPWEIYDGSDALNVNEVTSEQRDLNNPLPQATSTPEILETRVRSEAKPPYYYDQDFGLMMYRGEGYNKYPVVLGTLPGHVELCQQWDIKEAIRQQGYSELQAMASSSTAADLRGHSEGEEDPACLLQTEMEKRCLETVLQVFPDIQHDFVLDRLRMTFRLDGEHLTHADPQELITDILEHGDYPKQSGDETTTNGEDDHTGRTIKPVKGDALVDRSYRKNARTILEWWFRHVPRTYLQNTLRETGTLFDTFVQVTKVDQDQSKPKPFKKHKLARSGPLSRGKPIDRWEQVVNELQAARQHVARNDIKLERQQKLEEEENRNLATHKERKEVVECGVCCDEAVPMNRAVPCDGETIHWFCFPCIRRSAETKVGLMQHEMKCMDMSDCKAFLHDTDVKRAMPLKLFDKILYYRQQAEISEAQIEGLEQCRYCDFKAICDRVEVEVVFNCQNDECRRAYCRLCGNSPHASKTCEEAKAMRAVTARQFVEEARSEAVMRTCPHCKVKIIKLEGCNKVTCTKCHHMICYCCRADITTVGYSHFKQPGSKCFVNDTQMALNKLHRVEADDAERKAIEEVISRGTTEIRADDLRIETGKPKRSRDLPQSGSTEQETHPVHLLGTPHVAGMAPNNWLQRLNPVPATVDREDALVDALRAPPRHEIAELDFPRQTLRRQFVENGMEDRLRYENRRQQLEHQRLQTIRMQEMQMVQTSLAINAARTAAAQRTILPNPSTPAAFGIPPPYVPILPQPTNQFPTTVDAAFTPLTRVDQQGAPPYQPWQYSRANRLNTDELFIM